MKFTILKKRFVGNNEFFIKNENDEVVYKFFSVFKFPVPDTIMADSNGNEIAKFKLNRSNFIPIYEIYNKDVLAFTIQLKPTPNKYVFNVSNGYRAEGTPRGYNFTIFDEKNNQIATITKKFLSSKYKCEVEILDTSKIIIILIIAKMVAMPGRFQGI